MLRFEFFVCKCFCLLKYNIKGISIGYEKPNLDYFFNHVVIALKKLEYGIPITTRTNHIHNAKFFVTSLICDKPAKAMVLNMIQWNGHYGCTKCLQRGISSK